MPTLWFRNTWSWYPGAAKPVMRLASADAGLNLLEAAHASLGGMWLAAPGSSPVLFTENETNTARLYGAAQDRKPVKDGIHTFVTGGDRGAISAEASGTKAAIHFQRQLRPGESWVVPLRLCNRPLTPESLGAEFNSTLRVRQKEADEFIMLPKNWTGD